MRECAPQGARGLRGERKIEGQAGEQRSRWGQEARDGFIGIRPVGLFESGDYVALDTTWEDLV